MSSYSTGIPTSFDPALLYSDYDHIQNASASFSHSDEIEALQACIAEDIVKKNDQGIVIRHRAWNTADVFRSEGEQYIGTASCERCCYQY